MKRSKKTLILLAVLVLFVGGYYLLMNANETAQVAEETGKFDLTARTEEELTGLAWTVGETSFRFAKADGSWVNSSDAAFLVDQDAVQALADDVIALTATRKLESVTDLAAYGLAEPSFTLTVTWDDGTSTTYAMGDETPFADGYYLTLGQEGIAYTIADSLADIFDTTMTALAQMETIPAAEEVIRITVGSALDASYAETSATINADQHWYDVNGNALDGVDELVSAAQSIAWDALVLPAATEDELTAWQLDDANATAITLFNGEAEAVKLLLGATNESGDYYARLPGSSMVYTVAASDVTTLLTTTTESLISTALVETAYERLQEAVFTTDSLSYVLQPMDVATDTDVEVEDPGEAVWDALTAITATQQAEAAGGETLLTVSITTVEGVSATVTFTEYDVDNYAASMNGRALLVSADKVDKLIRAIKAAQ